MSNALPRIIADLHGSQSVYTWIVTTELLAMTATVPPWGKMADLLQQEAAHPAVAGPLRPRFADRRPLCRCRRRRGHAHAEPGLAAQNDVPAQDLGAATSGLTFFRSMGGAVGVSALGAVLADRVTDMVVEKFGPAATGSGTAAVPDLKALPPAVLTVIQDIYGDATAELFLVGTPFAVLALLTVLFIKEKPLHTLSGTDRMAKEEAESGQPVPPMPAH